VPDLEVILAREMPEEPRAYAGRFTDHESVLRTARRTPRSRLAQLYLSTGAFDTAYRPFTRNVEGMIRMSQHLIMVTLRGGGAAALEVTSSCGHLYSGSDRPRAVSFVPAHCERQLSLHDVQAEWASISLSSELFDPKVVQEYAAYEKFDIPAVTNREDRLVSAMLTEMPRLSAIDGALDATYCDTMSLALHAT
jgi:AraC family transcriptional regulator